ncbi:hypothetical protein [Aurantiacibacter poecillastricola]|uniref:hypothetical protein n=1 Tax=Aurantiacibacter poecillastricola TaxID=3064385 RepID=UPI00273F475F|nr:hypothetical protein [Aurantiacibacter sp. 219JJ12-13]MDP5261883.1 hypothetical protein [Aurantiacibacter sp. 219JJ12-13]
MTEERVVRTETPAGNTHTETTIVRDEPSRSSGNGKWIFLVLIAVIAIGAFVVFSQMSDAEIAKDNAVAGAAESVGNAAGDIGNAAENVGNAAQDAAENVAN